MVVKWGVPGRASVLVDGQFGSTGKGLMAAYLAERAKQVDVATCNAGAQAGHTTVYRDGRRFVCFHLPTTAVVRKCKAYINAGSIIDPSTIFTEVAACGVSWSNITVHPNAAIIRNEDRLAERAAQSSTEKLASTQKGVGSALSNKIMRRAPLAGNSALANMADVHFAQVDLNLYLDKGKSVVVEVPQGCDLSLNHGFAYPYVTSRDCWVGSGLSDAGIHPSFCGPVAMVVRTFPIRVGDLYNEMGEKIGTSGPFYPDSFELDWATHFPGVEPERTTVTKRVRRIATWSDGQYHHALSLNRPNIVALNFCNYLKTKEELHKLTWRMDEVCDTLGMLRPSLLFGFGPCVEDVTDDFDQAMTWYEKGSF